MPTEPTDESDSHEDDEPEMMWAAAAREAIQHAIAEARFDEIRGSMYLMSAHDHRWNAVEEEFQDLGDLSIRLTEIGESEWINYAPFDGGEPVFGPDVEDFVADALSESGAEEFFTRRLAEPNYDDEPDAEELIKADEMLVKGAGLVVEIDVAEINSELIRYLAEHPEKMREMDARKFEELVAELFKDKGYDVEVTPRSKDGGLDIRVFHRSDLGSFVTLVECKRYAETNKVEVGIVRQLYGVVSADNATSGLIATTSFFTAGAKSFQKRLGARLKLADFEELKAWLKAYQSKHPAS
jgi:hypothetical protein